MFSRKKINSLSGSKNINSFKMPARKDISSLSSDKKIKNLIKIRNISHIFYLFSFSCFLAFYIMYLYSNKKLSSCTYGSTLFCNNEITYPITLNSTDTHLNQITFNNSDVSTTGSTLITYPYGETSNYTINYFFGTTGGIEHVNGIGVSYQTDGASIYFNPIPNNLPVSLVNWTRTILENKIGNNIIINYKANQGTFQYTYKTNSSNIRPIGIQGSVVGSQKQVQPSDNDPVNGNWVNLLKRNQIQEMGCSSGTSVGCGVPDPAYISNQLCSQFVQNQKTGFYCPPDNLDCELCTANTIEDSSSGCGFSFCNPTTDNVVQNNTAFKKNDYGYYQNSIIPGHLPPNYTYKVGVGGKPLEDVFGEGNDFKDYNLQSHSFAAGNHPSLNNYNNENSNIANVSTSSSEHPANFLINAKYGQWSSGKNFDF